MLDLLSNNNGDLATSDTRGITDEIIEELRSGAHELLDPLAPNFDRLEATDALDVLLTLAETPISLLRCAGYTWEDIERYLVARIRRELGSDLDQVDRNLMQHIDLGEWVGFADLAGWQWHAAYELFLTPQELERRLERLKNLRDLRWDDRQGTLVFTS